MLQPILTVDQVADLLQVHVMTVYRLAKAANLPAFKVGSRWRFRRESIEAWMADRAQIMRLEAEGQPRRPKARRG